MKPVFDNVRWGELLVYVVFAGWAAYQAVAPEGITREEWASIAVAMLFAFLGYLRNPKRLEWKED